MKKFFALLLALVMVMSIIPAASAEGEKVFRLATTTEPYSIDPCMGNSIGENEIQYALTESLTRNIAGDVQPGLAESWDVDETGMIYTFHIREDAKWSDGVKITANDFEYSWKRLANPATGSGYAWILDFLEGYPAIEAGTADAETLGVKALDENTFEVRLRYVAPYFLSLIGASGQFAPCRKDIVEKWGADFAATAEKNVYSGPFKLISSEDLTYIFEPNEYYWNKEAVHFDRVELYVVADANTQLAMYEQGELDYVLLPSAQVSNYTEDSRHGEFINGNTDWMYINNKDPQLSNKNLRLAMNYALSRVDYNELANDGVYQPFNGLVCNIVAGLDGKYFSEMYADNRIFPLEGDQAKAQEYLKLAMEELGVTNPADIVLELTSTDNESTKKICEVVQYLLQTNLGITINIRQVTYGEIYHTVFPNHDYQFGYGGWGPDYDDPYTYLYLFYGPCSYNYSSYENPEVDALLEDATKNPDLAARMDSLGQAEKLILADGALLPLQMRTAHYLLDEDVTGIHFYYGSVNIAWAYGDVK